MWAAANQQCADYEEAAKLIHDSLLHAIEVLTSEGADIGAHYVNGAEPNEMAERTQTMYLMMRTVVAAGAALLPVYEKAMQAFENAPRIHRVN